MIGFLCGCRSGTIVAFENLATMDTVTLDDEGFVICKVHRQRRYGWRSVPYTATTKAQPGMGAWSPLEYERWVLFGEIPLNRMPVFVPNNVPDRRDNRDPEAIGAALLRRENGYSRYQARRIKDVPQA